MFSSFTTVESVENAAVDTSDMVGLVLVTLEVDWLVVSFGVDVPWDTVSSLGEPLGEAEKLDVVTIVSVI